MFKSLFRLYKTGLFLILVGCSSADKIDANTAEGAYALAQRYEKDERFEEAITYYAEVKNKFPYSRFAVDAELKIADVEFQRENYVEAEAAYKIFREFHPDHSRMDYVLFRLGMSVYHQLPPTIDRDLSLAATSIDHFSTLVRIYPQSPHTPESLKQIDKVKKMLAEKAKYVADFYFIREKWESALGRYEELLQNHSGFEAQALYGATLSAYNNKELDKAKKYFKRLLAEHPNSTELASARKELADGF